MGLVLTVSNGLHFLVAWELFAICGYFLITLDRERSGVRADQIIEIVCTGGSSAIPAARSLLRKRFANAVLRDAAAHTAVAAGLARAPA